MSNLLNLAPLGDWGTEQRKQFHIAFNNWLVSCQEQDYVHLMALREQVAPSEVCSSIKLVRSSFSRPDLRDSLPASLVQLMQERNLLPASSDATFAAG